MYLCRSMGARVLCVTLMLPMSHVFGGEIVVDATSVFRHNREILGKQVLVFEKCVRVQKIIADLRLFPGVITHEIIQYLEPSLECWCYLKTQFSLPSETITHIGFMNKNTLMYTWDPKAGSLMKVDIGSGRQENLFLRVGGFGSEINTVSSQGDFIAHSSRRGCRLQVWCVKNKKYVFSHIHAGGAVYSINFSPNTAYMAVGYQDKCVKVWRQNNNDNQGIWTLIGELMTDAPQKVAFHPQQNSCMLYGLRGKVWCDLNKPSKETCKQISKDPVRNFIYSPQGSYDITFADTGCEILLKDDFRSIVRIDSIENLYQVRFCSISPCEQFLTTISDKNPALMTMWQVKDYAQGVWLKKYMTDLSVSCVSFSPDGSLFALFMDRNIHQPKADTSFSQCIIL
jgi:WD40 repeat protein